ncbi:MAG: hypothetical protein ABFS42_11095 [Candidatus Krumholzibacteriota bacterium]
MRLFFLFFMLPLILVAGCHDYSSAPMIPQDDAVNPNSEIMPENDEVVTLNLPTVPEVTWFDAVPAHTRYGETIRMRARVQEANRRGDSPGEVGFFDGEIHLATVPIDAENGAVFEISTLEPCRHLLSARYVGIDSLGNTYVSEKSFVAIVTNDAENARSEGYWQHQCSGFSSAEIDIETMECYLSIVGEASGVFSEIHDVTTISSTYEVLFMGGNKGSALEQFDRELLVAWLNYANGAFGYGELLCANKDCTRKMHFFSVMMDIELFRLKSNATKKEIKDVMQILHHLNNMVAPTTDRMR